MRSNQKKLLRFTYMKNHLLIKILGLIMLFVSLVITSLCIVKTKENLTTGAENINDYIRFLEGKNVAIVSNQTSMVGKTHLVDTLLSLGLKLVKIGVIFAPEHGFRDFADAGESIKSGRDPKTGISVISLYGSHLKPTAADLNGINTVLFDIQDVGARFYTYVSTLHLVMESCAENKIRCIVLDRPNPNGYYFDGNIPDSSYKSFVCMDPVPIVHGLTVGEYAMMVNGEGWLNGGMRCDLTVIKCKNYDHKTHYELPVRPSPNLPNQTSIYLYPSLCFFEGTVISCGRGTNFPFQAFGDPNLPDRGFSFIPESVPGAKYPIHLGQKCFGTDLRNAIKDGLIPSQKLHLEWIITAYRDYPEKSNFFTPYFDVLAGGPVLREQIQKGMSEKEIRATWKEGLAKFLKIREKYLLYKE
jgi:uncharacterized protein YbbC (DUF1343 family)